METKLKKFFMPKGKRGAPKLESQLDEEEEHTQPSIMRSITRLNMAVADEQGARPVTAQSQARFSLARRAFLRHSFNRLDLVAVLSYWISLVICISGVEAAAGLVVLGLLFSLL